jgi:hypothetical protein
MSDIPIRRATAGCKRAATWTSTPNDWGRSDTMRGSMNIAFRLAKLGIDPWNDEVPELYRTGAWRGLKLSTG